MTITPRDPTIRLTRGVANSTTVAISIQSDGAWHLTAADTTGGPGHGHMRLAAAPGTVLGSAMEVTLCSGPPRDLTASTPIVVCRGSGSESIPVIFGQTVGATDVPGTYGIRIVFTAVAGF
jgi:hypothetical protein